MTCTKSPCLHGLAVGTRYRIVVASNPDLVYLKDDGDYDAVTCRLVEPVESEPAGPS